MSNVDPIEINKFDAASNSWWDLQGELRTLHQINPLRLQYINDRVTLNNANAIDIGCGGGILSEALAKAGATVTAIDMSEEALKAANEHAKDSQLNINYLCTTAEDIAEEQTEQFDVVTCMEMLEHVPDPVSVIAACAKLCKPNGHVFFSTLNRNPKSFALAIVAAEYLLNLVPRGTHHYSKFIKPAELADAANNVNLETKDVSGIFYNPITGHHKLNRDVDVNYLMHTIKAQ